MSNLVEARRAVYDPGLNSTGSTIDAYKLVSGGPSSIALAAGITAVTYGATARDIPDGERGDIQTEGWAPVLAGTAGMTEGALVMAEAGGTGLGVDWGASSGANAVVVGTCRKTAAVGKLGLVHLGVGAIGQGA